MPAISAASSYDGSECKIFVDVRHRATPLCLIGMSHAILPHKGAAVKTPSASCPPTASRARMPPMLRAPSPPSPMRPTICKPMGMPSDEKPHGTLAAVCPDGVDWVCERQVAEEGVNFLPANGRGMLLYLERGYRHCRRQQQIVVLEERIELCLQHHHRTERPRIVCGSECSCILHRLTKIICQFVRMLVQQIARRSVCVRREYDTEVLLRRFYVERIVAD